MVDRGKIMMFFKSATLMASMLLAAPALAGPVEINFDELADGNVIANQYSSLGVAFSSTPGQVNLVTR
jgi:hypothetical protein